MNIISYNLQYQQAFISLYKETFLNSPIYREVWTDDQVQSVLEENEVYILVDKEDQLMGFVAGNSYADMQEKPLTAVESEFLSTKNPSDVVWVSELVMQDNCRGKGFGKQLLEFFLSTKQQEGIEWFLINTTVNNPARRLYERVGFQAIVDEEGSIIKERIASTNIDGPCEYENLYMWLGV